MRLREAARLLSVYFYSIGALNRFETLITSQRVASVVDRVRYLAAPNLCLSWGSSRFKSGPIGTMALALSTGCDVK